MKKLLLIVLIAAAGMMSFTTSQDYKFERTFIYNFTKYIQWPAAKQSGDFVIGVYGDSPIIAQLELMAQTRSAGAQKFKINKITSVGQIGNPHILFVSKTKNGEIGSILSKVNGGSTLLITEGDGLAEQGSGINFIYINGKPRFELNKSATEKQNLKVSSELMKLAIVI